MSDTTRRTFIKTSGAALGGIAVGSTVTAAESTERFVIDTKGYSGSLGDLTVVHDLDAIDAAVVTGSESDVEDLGVDYGRDTQYELDRPAADETPVPADEDATDEPFYGLQWDKEVQGVPDAHEVTRGEGTRVAVIDTGVAAGHPDLAHAVNEELSRNFAPDDFGAPGPWAGYHGTHVSGIIAADDGNDVGTVGTAPGTEIVDCRVFEPGELAYFSDILAAMVYSADIGCDAANLSIGAYPIPRQGLGEFYGGMLNRVTTYCNSQGTLLVIAAGNSGADLQHDGSVISLPNEAANVVSVSATGPIGFLWGEEGLREDFTSPAFYTNYGTNAIDVSAPGGDADVSAIGTGVAWWFDLVLSSVAAPDFDNGDHSYGWGWAAGTSMAAPQVAGAAALVKSVNPGFNANQVRQRIKNTADDVGAKEYHGAGFVDPDGAVNE